LIKLTRILIQAVYWLWAFIIPAGIMGFIAFWLYIKSPENHTYSIFIGGIGIAFGIFLAEYIRRHYGLDNFFGRISSSEDLDNFKDNGETIEK
jgi:uncharacterized BrkB/YihY/UPF0761 family membrane protein